MKKEKQNNDGVEQLSQIRSMMEESSRFISLSGISGIMAGVTALAGAAYAYFIIQSSATVEMQRGMYFDQGGMTNSLFVELLFVAVATLLVAFGFGVFFTVKKTRKKAQNVWTNSSRRLLINLFIPLAAGGVFGLILAYHGLFGLIAPATLIFYGLALVNASKYTLRDIRYLGLFEIALGLIASIYIGYGLLFWTIGFGLLHIIYGSLMYFKYDRA